MTQFSRYSGPPATAPRQMPKGWRLDSERQPMNRGDRMVIIAVVLVAVTAVVVTILEHL